MMVLGVNRVCCLRDAAADTPWKKGKTKEELEMSAMIGLASDKMLPEDDECLRCDTRSKPQPPLKSNGCERPTLRSASALAREASTARKLCSEARCGYGAWGQVDQTVRVGPGSLLPGLREGVHQARKPRYLFGVEAGRQVDLSVCLCSLV